VSAQEHAANRFEALVESSPDALLVVTVDGLIVLINAEVERMFGHPRGEVIGQHYGLLLSGVGVGDSGVADLLATTLQLVGHRLDGSRLAVEARISRLSDSPEEIAISVRESTNASTNDSELRAAVSLLNATLDSTADGILVVSRDGRIAGSNGRFATLWGIPAELLSSRDDDRVMSFVLDQLVDPAGFVDKVRELNAHPEAESNDVLTFRDGRTFERYSRPQRVANTIVGRVWSFRDVTARERAQDQARASAAAFAAQAEQLRVLALHDALTGLANRAMFHERLNHALAARDGRGVHVLLLDLDDFKEINDVLGHHSGDEVLMELGRRLEHCVRPEDTVARLGGDEFVVLLAGAADPDAVAERIVEAMSLPTRVQDTEIRVSVTLGIASTVDGLLEGPELLRRADIAMYVAKAAGKNRHVSFHPDMMTALLARTNMETGLRHAVERDEMIVHFQPIVDPENGLVSQFEVLVRWKRPTGLVPPLDFIPAAERSGAIVVIGEEVLRQACTGLCTWLDGSELRSVAVNVSAVQVREEHFAQRALAIAAECGVRPTQLVVEVTESVFLTPGDHVMEQLRILRDAGVRISIDDFGTGYSSLAQLQDLPVDAIKVDKSFVDKIVTGGENLPILNSMIDMAHNLGLHVTAEGVETHAQAAKLIRLGCDGLQGYLFSRPQPAGELPRAEERSAHLMKGVLSTGNA